MFVYSERYTLDWPEHVFPTEKYSRTYQWLCGQGIAVETNTFEPIAATREELLRVHDGAYLDRLAEEAARGLDMHNEYEAPLSPGVLDAVILAAGGTSLCCRRALRGDGARAWMNIGGGFHHAFADHGEGFCFINDIAVGAAAMLAEGRARRVMVVDGDVHQGNGTASIFADDSRVFTLDVHQENLYPAQKQPASRNISLPDMTGDERYMGYLIDALDEHAERFAPDLIIYVAGADPWVWDQLGGLTLSKDGFLQRDELIVRTARQLDAALVVVLGGGYPQDVYDVAEIHARTGRVLWSACGEGRDRT